MRMLDLFSGMGGASEAMKRRGWEVVTVDIDPKFKPSIVADMRAFHPPPGLWDLVWASPPCTFYSRKDQPGLYPNEPDPDNALVLEAKRVIEEARPRFWVIENVRGSRKYLNPILGQYKKCGSFYLWGVFPVFDVPHKQCIKGAPSPSLKKKHRNWDIRVERDPRILARIPRCISKALALAIEQEAFHV